MNNKYEQKRTVKAVYNEKLTNNPYIDSMPKELTPAEFNKMIANEPDIPEHVATFNPNEAKENISDIGEIFIPLNYMYHVYDTIYRMIRSTYQTRTAKENMTRINSIFRDGSSSFSVQAISESILGVPGIGKTTTITRCLNTMPQVIEHEKYNGNMFYTKQVLYLFVQCPSDGSAKTFCYNAILALDDALGTNHLEDMLKIRGQSTSAVASYLKILCVTYGVGILCVDEIQNLVSYAKRANSVKPLIRFLTELTNDSGTAIYFSGTNISESIFFQEEYLKRRTRGLRLLPFRYDGVYREFLERLWKYQYTPSKAQLTDKLANQIYDYSGGIPAYIIKIFQEAQIYAINTGKQSIDSTAVIAIAKILAIKPPRITDFGTFLSDFEECSINYNQANIINGKLTANKRGRKPLNRDEQDMLVWYNDKILVEKLMEYEMIEEVR